MSKSGGKGGADKLQQKSPAEFFAENKNIAGFDNVIIVEEVCFIGFTALHVCRKQESDLQLIVACSLASACTQPYES